MFGYITIAPGTLPPDRQERYRAHYCGLCRTLGRRFGAVGQMTLSYDVTFLYLLLSSLYEPEETEGMERCVPHPFKPHGYVQNELADYCCDMNIALAYHKCMDDWQDDSSLLGRGEAALLKKGYDQVQKRYPDKCEQIEKCLQTLHQLEVRSDAALDDAANVSAQMVGILYRYQEDLWADTLQRMGEALGRFIYLMDAYDDLDRDMRKGRFNALRPYRDQSDYETFVKESLTLLIAECTDAFETLPLVQDMDILRNILYAGCWTRYQQKQLKRERKNGTPDRRKEDGA